jgi:hypothetical protein
VDLNDPTDSARDVVAFLERRKCGNCRAPLGGLTARDIKRSPTAPKFRCLPPLPTAWIFDCPGCATRIMILVRRGKASPLKPEQVTRRSPQRSAMPRAARRTPA